MRKLPLYKNIEQSIEQEILSGSYPIHAQIPTEKELAEMYNTSRTTVRQALSSLETRGFLERVAGKGTFVSDIQKVEHGSKIESFTEEMKRQGKTVETEILDFKLVDAPKKVQEKLQLGETEKVYYFERLRSADDVPMVLEKTYMSAEEYPEMNLEILLHSKYRYVEEKKKTKIAFAHQYIYPIIAPDDVSEQLKIDKGSPILLVNNVTFLDDGTIMDHTDMFINPKKWEFSIIRSRN